MKLLWFGMALNALGFLPPAAAAAPTVFATSEVDRKPVLGPHPLNIYPVTMTSSHKAAIVLVALVVDAKGNVAVARLVDSAAMYMEAHMTSSSSPSPGSTQRTEHADGYNGPDLAYGRDPEVKATDKGPFERAALRAVQHWHFQPGQKGGSPVNTRILVKVIFTVDGQSHFQQLI